MTTTSTKKDVMWVRPASGKQSRWVRFWRKNAIAYLFILPAFAFLATFMVYPIADGLMLTLYRWDGISAREFVGLANFVYIARDPKFLTAFVNTVFFTVVTTGAKIILGFLLAAALHSEVQGTRFFRGAFYITVILPMTAIGVLWGAILNPITGPIEALLHPLGGSMPSMLGSPTRVMWTLSAVDIWKHVGFPMIFLLAAMEGIPQEMYEAAELDGAGGLKRIWYITLPLVKPVLLTITMLQTIFSFKVFDIVFTMTKGGPANASQVLTTYLYQEGFWFQRFGSASMAGLVLLVFCMIFSYVYVRQGRIGQSEFEF